MLAPISSRIRNVAFGIVGSFIGLILMTLAVAACGDDPVDAEPSLGTIEIRTITEGDILVPDSFEVQIHGAKSGNTGPNALYYMENLPRGRHQVGLKETAEDCRFQTNPRSILVTPNDTSETTFLIFCR